MSGFDEAQANRTLQTMLVLYTFVGSWVISITNDHLANEINQSPYYVKVVIHAKATTETQS